MKKCRPLLVKLYQLKVTFENLRFSAIYRLNNPLLTFIVFYGDFLCVYLLLLNLQKAFCNIEVEYFAKILMLTVISILIRHSNDSHFNVKRLMKNS